MRISNVISLSNLFLAAAVPACAFIKRRRNICTKMITDEIALRSKYERIYNILSGKINIAIRDPESPHI